MKDQEIKGGIMGSPFKLWRKLKKAIVGSELEKFIFWNHELCPGLLWRIPDPLVKNRTDVMAKAIPTTPEKMEKAYGFVVMEYEKAIFLQKGQFIDECESGYYQLEKDARVPGTEIVWIDTREMKVKWGISETLTLDNIMIGAYGTSIIKINNPKNFILNVISAKRQLDPENVENWIKDALRSAIAETFSKMEIVTLHREHDVVLAAVKGGLQSIFLHWGVELIHLEILGLNIPDEYKDVLQESAKLQILETKKKIEAKQLELEAQRVITSAEIEARADEFKAQGLKALDMATAEVETEKYKKFAEIAQSGLDIGKVMQAEGVKSALTKSEIKSDSLEGIGGLSVVSSKKRDEIEAEIKKCKELIEKCDEKLLEGTLSEEKHDEIVSRLKKKIEILRNK